jgi:hypothetical protein
MLFVITRKYYLVDAGYPNEYCYLGSYKGKKYHLQDFRRRGQLRNRQEVFNRAHSSLRNVIEYFLEYGNKCGGFYKTCLLIHTKRKLKL